MDTKTRLQKLRFGRLRLERKKKLEEFEKALSSLRLLLSPLTYLDLDQSYQLLEKKWDFSFSRYVSEEMKESNFKNFLLEVLKVIPSEKVWLFFDEYPWAGGLDFNLHSFIENAVCLAQFDLSGVSVIKQEAVLKTTGMLVDFNFDQDSFSESKTYQLYVWGEWIAPCAHLLHPEKRH